MRLQSFIRKVPWFHGFTEGNWGKSWQNPSDTKHGAAKECQEVQSLTGRVAVLNRFVLKATEKCLPFFKVLRKAFEWMDECQWAFEELKAYLTTDPLLSPSKSGEKLYLYLAISPHAMSLALVREEGKAQKPVYYTNKALRGAERWYPSPPPPKIEKLAFSLVTAIRKLRPYF